MCFLHTGMQEGIVRAQICYFLPIITLFDISRRSINCLQIPWCCSKQQQHVNKMYSILPVLGRTFHFGLSRLSFSLFDILIRTLESPVGYGGEPVSQKNLIMNWVLPWWSTCLPAPRPVRKCWSEAAGCSYLSVKDRSQYESPSK